MTARRRVDRPSHTLIVMAHHDSKSQNLTFPYRNGLVIIALAGTLGLLGVLLAALLSGSMAGPTWLPPALGGTAAAALLVLSTLKSGNESPGGVDNAGSVSILLELARRLPGELDERVELIFLSPGAEEDHMVGAMRWLDAHLDELQDRPVYALNLDGAGSPGRAVILERFGAGRHFGRRVAAAASRAAKRLGIGLRRIWLPPAMGVDAIPFRHRGLECVTFSSGSLGRATIAVHSAGDIADNLDEETLDRLYRLVRAAAHDLAGAR